MNEKPRVQFLTTTLIGGLLFMVPVVFLLFILGKAFGLMLIVAKPMATWLPIDTVGGVALANLIALLAIILLCFLAGLLARSALASGLVKHLEEKMLMKIPGYALIRGLKSSIDNSDEAKLRPVLVDLGYCQRLGFQSEQLPDGRCVVYLPGSPNTWSGITLVAAAEQVEYLDAPLKEMIDLFEGYGYGTAEVLAPGPGSEHLEASEPND